MRVLTNSRSHKRILVRSVLRSVHLGFLFLYPVFRGRAPSGTLRVFRFRSRRRFAGRRRPRQGRRFVLGPRIREVKQNLRNFSTRRSLALPHPGRPSDGAFGRLRPPAGHPAPASFRNPLWQFPGRPAGRPIRPRIFQPTVRLRLLFTAGAGQPPDFLRRLRPPLRLVELPGPAGVPHHRLDQRNHVLVGAASGDDDRPAPSPGAQRTNSSITLPPRAAGSSSARRAARAPAAADVRAAIAAQARSRG